MQEVTFGLRSTGVLWVRGARNAVEKREIMLGLILCAVSVLQERIRREHQSLIKGNTAGTGPPSEYVTSVLAFFIKHTTERPVPEVVWSFVQFIPDTSWQGFAYFLKQPKTFEQ